ncbi:Transcription factor [Nymphaea thermarum]|nr:Transcription factor [Nymphaea thermarum]
MIVKVAEEPSLVQHILTFFLVVSKPVCSEQSTFNPQKSDDNDDDEGKAFTKIDSGGAVPMLVDEVKDPEQCSQFSESQKALPSSLDLTTPKEETGFETNTANFSHVIVQEVVSPGHSSNGNGPHQQPDDSYMLDELTDACQVQMWRQVEEETSEAAHDSMNLSDCISQSFVNNRKHVCPTHNERLNQYMQELQECTHTKFKSGANEKNSHYSKTLSAILRDSLLKRPVDTPSNFSFKASLASSSDNPGFSRWRMGVKYQMQLIDTPQKLLKKVLFEVAWMHQKRHETQGNADDKDILWKQVEGASCNHVLSEERGREKLKEQFLVLRSLVPSSSKLDKASLLGDTIDYLKQLEARVEELESYKELIRRKRCPDVTERTSDNYASNGSVVSKKYCRHERNASTGNEPRSELQWVLCKDGTTDVMVTITEKDVSVDIQCPWRESLLLEIIQAMHDLHLDSQTIKSSMVDGILKLALRAKAKKAAGEATDDIKHALQRILKLFFLDAVRSGNDVLPIQIDGKLVILQLRMANVPDLYHLHGNIPVSHLPI